MNGFIGLPSSSRASAPGGVFAQHGAEGIDKRFPEADPVAARPVVGAIFSPTGPGPMVAACARLAEELTTSGVAVGGFLTREIREDGERNVAAFEDLALHAIREAVQRSRVAIVGELGQMELSQARSSSRPVSSPP
jgi:hypothetical protein